MFLLPVLTQSEDGLNLKGGVAGEPKDHIEKKITGLVSFAAVVLINALAVNVKDLFSTISELVKRYLTL